MLCRLKAGIKNDMSIRYDTSSPHGLRNLITDVPGVTVGHATINEDSHHTGVTVIIPCEDFVYAVKPIAASYVLNGYGKTAGTIQIDELGTIETPIALTNTLSVGTAADALVDYTLMQSEKYGLQIRSLNPVVGETNDGRINDIADRAVRKEHVMQALQNASKQFELGSAGAGTGTVCFGLKGGIGSSSRIFAFAGKEYTLGVLVQSNYGRMEDLTIHNDPIGRRISQKLQVEKQPDVGSIMVIIGTDLPVDSRQLKRILKRASVGIIRCGSYMGHGSGDVFIGFSNANTMQESKDLVTHRILPEEALDEVFHLCGECVEEAVISSLLQAETVTAYDGTVYHCLREFL